MELQYAQAQFRADLVAAELLVQTSVDGLYGRSGAFEDIVEGIDRMVVAAGTRVGARAHR